MPAFVLGQEIEETGVDTLDDATMRLYCFDQLLNCHEILNHFASYRATEVDSEIIDQFPNLIPQVDNFSSPLQEFSHQGFKLR